MCNYGLEEQKYLAILLSKQLQPKGDELFKDKHCHHAKHASIIGGLDANGNSRAQQTETYEAPFADDLAVIITTWLIPPHQRAAEKPPFSTEPRIPSLPPVFPQRPAAATDSPIQCIEDEIMEQAETVEALDNQLDALYGIDTTRIT